MSRVAIVAGVAATFFAGNALPVKAQTASPIGIQSCTVQQEVSTIGPYRRFWYPWPRSGYAPYTDGLNISYVNTSNMPIDRVVFVVDYRGDKERVVDAGTFSPGVTINHQFGEFEGDAYIGPKPNSCRVVAVRFSNGTAWRASNLRPVGYNR